MSSKSKTASKTRSSRAGLIFPVGRVHKMLRKGNYAPRLGGASSVYLTAALEYLAAEVLELAVDVCLEKEKRRVVPRHLLYAIRKDEELNTLLTGVTISQSGVIPHILGQLLPPKTMKHNSSESQSQQF